MLKKKMLKSSSSFCSLLNGVFFVSLIAMMLSVGGLVPRAFIFVPALLILAYLFSAPYEDAVLFFVRFIPFFFALPFTADFDNFNLWRIAIIIVFLRWVFTVLRPAWLAKIDLRSWLGRAWSEHRAEVLGLSLFCFAFLSLSIVQDIYAGLKQFIYFVNLVLLCFVIRDLVASRAGFLRKLAANFFLSGALAIAIGFLQWGATYLIPVSVFHLWWGQVISLNMYGGNWADIVTNFGNTWFSYSGGGLRLRMFSLFPDSHTFPLYLLMILPFLFLLITLFEKRELREQRVLGISFLLLHLALILSGTRGIWVSIIAPAIFLAVFRAKFKDLNALTRKIALSLLAFFVMFPLAWGIIFIPQFKDETGSSGALLVTRLRSIIDLYETSNKGRIGIWKKTIRSIEAHPVLGVGMGNYPVVLKEDIIASKAGASAHNLFLHIAAIMGIPALFVLVWFFWETMKRGFQFLTNAAIPREYRLFAYASLFALVWILAYSMTDVALFDERAFLGFMVFLGAVLGLQGIAHRRRT